MHELSIAHAVVETVVESAGARRIASVRLRVGGLAGVVPDALRFAFDVARADTVCAGATLVIDEVPVTVWCEPCGAERALDGPLRFRCPACGASTPDVRGGRELDVVSYTLAEPAGV